MKTKILSVTIILLAFVGGVLILMKLKPDKSERRLQRSVQPPISQDQAPHQSSRNTPRVPAYQSASEVRTLPATLPPAQFVGKAREAYQVAKEIPQTLAQLPCYCHCDASLGHKSLHTCFEDDHASHCAVCVDEALLAFQLQRQEKLTPEQVRERIIQAYSVLAQH